MAKSGIQRIDELLSGAAGTPAIVQGDSDLAATGVVQELLRGHGYGRLPDMRHESYGKFGELTRQSVLAYRAAAGLGDAARVDAALLEDLLRRPAGNPLAARCYLTQVLDIEYTPLVGLISLTCLWESGARFACLNLNTDRCGLSFGIIQWAQRPGRLHGLLEAFRKAEPGALEEIAGDPAGLLAHTGRPNGGVDPRTGVTTDPRFDLVAEPWRGRFERMGQDRRLQKVQVAEAVAAFRASTDRIRRDAPRIESQRGFAFMLDLANQHGDAGAAAIYRAVTRPGMAEKEILAAMEAESVRRVAAQYGAASAEAGSTASRRRFFRTTAGLSDAAGSAAWA